jgi:uncharacterized protein YeaO (DUF488 family)
VRPYVAGSATTPKNGRHSSNRYYAELDNKPEALRPLVEAIQRGHVTLLYSAHDTAHNNAMALKLYLEEHLLAQQQESCQR